MPSRATIDRMVRREAAKLLQEARSCLKSRAKLPQRVREEMERRTRSLEEAHVKGDAEAMRAEITPLDALVDQHMVRKSTLREYTESIGIAILIALFLRAFVVEAFKIPSGSMIPTMEIGDHIFVNKFLYGVLVPFTRTKFFEYRKPRRGEVIVFINPCQPDKDFIKRIVAVGGDTVELRCNVLWVNGKPVPHELVEQQGQCEYWDYTGNAGGWYKNQCIRYVEDFAGVHFSTLYDPRRRMDDRLRDFPDLRFGIPEMPSCERDPQRTAEGTAALGSFEDSYPERDLYTSEGVCAPKKRYRVPEGHVFVMGDNRDDSSDSRVWGVVPLENIKGKALFIWWSQKPGSGLMQGVSWDRIGKVVY